MTAREATLARIRTALADTAPAPPVARDYRRSGDLSVSAAQDLFARRVAEYRATVHSTDSGGLPSVIATILATSGHGRVVVPPGLPAGWLAGVDATVDVVTDDGDLTTQDLDRVDAVVTGCAVAIADTGTIVLDAALDQGRRIITLLPDHHVCVVRAEQVVATVPQGLQCLNPTRPLTLISGPSATSDIELNRVEGVHGPRNLDVILVAAREAFGSS